MSLSRVDAQGHITATCFPVRPPRLIGAELEWLTRLPSGERPSRGALAAALGDYAPDSVVPDPDGHVREPRLLSTGSRITVEPGGQVETSSRPAHSVSELIEILDADRAAMQELLAAQDITIVDAAIDAHRAPIPVLTMPRYTAMEKAFAPFGDYGLIMMCNTAAVQVSVDTGASKADVERRWHMLNAVGPALVSAFARSAHPNFESQSRWVSHRMHAWIAMDTRRVLIPNALADNPIEVYSAWAVDAPLMCVRSDDAEWNVPAEASFGDWIDGALDDAVGRRPTIDDLNYHLTTLFPPVRACGYLEVRYFDAQPKPMWSVPIHAIAALTSSPGVVREARDIGADTAQEWETAAHVGLQDAQLRSTAQQLLQLAADVTESAVGAKQLADAARRCALGLSPDEEDQ